MGGRVIVVQANEEDAEKVTFILRQEKASGVKSLEWKESFHDAALGSAG